MRIDRRMMMAAPLAGGLLAGGEWAHAAGPGGAPLLAGAQVVPLWPEGPPLGMAPGMTVPQEVVTERSTRPDHLDRAVTGVAQPRLLVFRPERPNGAAVVVMPGGGYVRLAIDKEGTALAHWLAGQGFVVGVLIYRLPGEGWASGADTPLIDAQRAMRLMRHHAADWGVEPARVAAMGFSAGGHVCADLAARFAAPAYAPVDAADGLAARPLCAAPIYPVVSMHLPLGHSQSRRQLLGPEPTRAMESAHSPDENIPADAPPHFLLHAEDDPTVAVGNTLALRAALKARGVAVETHLYPQGGHGFGLGPVGSPLAQWPQLWRAWAVAAGLVGAA